MFTPLSIVGVVLNLLVIVAILRNQDLRKEYLSFSILSLSLTDFLWSLSVTPLLALLGFLKDFAIPNGCEFYGFLVYALWETSVLTLVGFATLRVAGVWFPEKLKTEEFQLACKVVPISCWLLAALTLIPILSQQNGRFGFECKKFLCIIVDIDKDQNQLALHPIKIFMSIIVCAGVLSIALNIITFIQISRKTRRLFRQMKDTNRDLAIKILQREKRLGSMVMGITGSFFLVYCPITILLIIDPNAAITKPIIYTITQFLASSLVVIDPIIYTISQKRYRKEVQSLIIWLYEWAASLQIK